MAKLGENEAASSPSDVRRDSVQDKAKRGVMMGWTRGGRLERAGNDDDDTVRDIGFGKVSRVSLSIKVLVSVIDELDDST